MNEDRYRRALKIVAPLSDDDLIAFGTVNMNALVGAMLVHRELNVGWFPSDAIDSTGLPLDIDAMIDQEERLAAKEGPRWR